MQMNLNRLSIIYKESSSRCHRERVDISDLSEDEFIKTYHSDPFFKERVDVEIEKLIKSAGGVNLKLAVEGSPEDLNQNDITFKKKSSMNC